jgi:hypothetical protein
MRRLYFLIPDAHSAGQIVNELLLARIEERHMHVIGKDHDALVKENLPEASLVQKSDLVPALERGIAVGGAAGLVAGLAALVLPGGLVIAGGAILGSSLLGAGLGAWISSMIGISAPNSRLTRFEKAIEAGELLMLIDVPKGRTEEITELVRNHHPEANVEGTEPTIPPFP